MRRRKIIALMTFIIFLSACNRTIPSDKANDDYQKSYEGHILSDDRKIISTFRLDMDKDGALEIVKIIEKDNYTFSVELSKVNNDVTEIGNIIDLYGKVSSISQVDITNDGNTDILISADEGGSIGSSVYYYISYKENKLVNIDLSELINGENLSFDFDEKGVYVRGNNITEYIKFNDRVLRNLEELGISIASKYEVLPAILSFSNTYNQDVIITSKQLLIVEHKLNSVAEIRTDYVYHEGWKNIKTIITVVD